MKAELINYTQEARELLLYTKNTRLSSGPGLMEEIRAWPEEKKQAELEYMLGTIESSWEFVDYVFCITGVSRAFTHQLVRSRQASFAQQSQRTVDMSMLPYVAPPAIAGEFPPGDVTEHFIAAMDAARGFYSNLREAGAPPQDARAVLPEATETSIIGKFNLRTLSDMAKKRLCTRTQGEYQQVFKAMRNAVLEVHPWAEPFIRVHCARTGVCCFPNYKECPLKGPIFNPDTGFRWDGATAEYDGQLRFMRPATRDEIQKAWERMELFEAIPQQMKKES